MNSDLHIIEAKIEPCHSGNLSKLEVEVEGTPERVFDLLEGIRALIKDINAADRNTRHSA